MELNCIVFPAPYPPSYLCEEDISADGRLIFIPKTAKVVQNAEESKSLDSPAKNTFIEDIKFKDETYPCYYIPYTDGAGKVIIYFHGNAEDMGNSQYMMK